MKIWQRYFFFETLKTTIFVLFSFYALYILIDYASHTGSFRHHHAGLNLTEFIRFYGSEFVKRLEVLLPFALLIAFIRVLTKLNHHSELIALYFSGIKKRRILRPFLCLALLSVAVLYLNTELILPYAMKSSRKLNTRHMLEQTISHDIPKVHHASLEDGSLLLYKSFDNKTGSFFDVFWVKSVNEIFRMKTLIVKEGKLNGFSVEKIVRDPEGRLMLSQYSENLLLSPHTYNQKKLFDTIVPPEELALSDLTKKISPHKKALSEKQASIRANYTKKMLVPWLPLLVIFGVAPLCLKVSRSLNIFFIYAISLFALIAFYLVLNSATILGERQIFDPYLALIVPFAMMGSYVSFKYYGSL